VACSICGTDNPAGTKFCKECGSRLAAACRVCGAALLPDARFCGECGSPASPGGAAPGSDRRQEPAPGPAAVAERRVVSVLFADLVGFTALTEGQDAEETRELLSRYFELAREVIGRYGGIVEKFIGDAVMAVWGAPTAHEDDPERAVRAALELLDAISAFGPTIQARAGVLTGEAAVTLGATNQGMVAGDLVNTASRLQSVAPPGAVLVGEATQRAAAAAIAFEPAGEQLLKGKAAPVPAWRALRVVSERGGRNRAEGLEPPFVGRDDEFRLLKDLFHTTEREGRARLVSVIGAAGIGKTRLAWELEKYLDGLLGTVLWHTGRSPAYGDGIAFWALGEMIRERARLGENDDEATTRQRISAVVAEYVPDDPDRRWIEPALLALLGLETGVGPDQMFGAWRLFFERLASTNPVVMIFEDLHFADPGLLDFIDHLLEWSRAFPIYVVTLARPDLLERRPDWAAGKRNFTSLYLDPLSEPSMRELLAGLVSGLPAPTVGAVVARADGIPLYAVEIVRMLVAEGRVREENGRYVPTGDITSFSIPETLTALIASRLDGLGAADRSLVQDGAVLGQSFTLAGLSALSGIATDDLEPRLRSLVRQEILRFEADPRSAERGQYAFVQALIREVAYNTLARADRKTKHLAVARIFETLPTEELAGALAGHYVAAHANAPEGPEADALAAQARLALRGAADRASSLGSHDQALGYLIQAEAITSDPTQLAALWEAAGREANHAGQLEVARGYFERLIAAREAGADRSAMAMATAELGSILLTSGRVGEGLELLVRTAASFAPGEAPEGMAYLETELARAYMRSGRDLEAIAAADRALAVAERLELLDTLAESLTTKGTSLTSIGRYLEGLTLLRGALAISEEHGFIQSELRARQNLWFSDVGDPVRAIDVLRPALEKARRLGLREWTTDLTLVICMPSSWLGLDWDWIREQLAGLEAEGFVTEADRTIREILATAQIAMRSDPAGPIEELRRLAAALVGGDDGQLELNAAVQLTWTLVAAGRPGEALQWANQVMASDFGGAWTVCGAAAGVNAATWAADREGLARCDRALEGATGRWPHALRQEIAAARAALSGDRAAAIERYRDAFGLLRDLGAALPLAVGVIGACRLLGPIPELSAEMREAREILSGLGAVTFLGRADEAFAEPPPDRHEVPLDRAVEAPEAAV
jgi:class 3 adenylate cyclase/tetratricopeptide (TPR) repeat protein